MQRKVPLLAYLFFILIVWMYLFRMGIGKASREELILASAIFFLSNVPFLLYLNRRKKIIPYFSVFGIYFFTYYAFSVFASHHFFEIQDISREIVIKSLNLAVLGIASSLLAFHTVLGSFIDVAVPHLKLPWDRKRAYPLAVSTVFCGLFFSYLLQVRSVGAQFGGIVGFLADLSKMGIAILYLLHLEKQLSRRGTLILLFAFLLRCTLDLTTGSNNLVVMDFLTIILVHFYHFRRVPWKKIVVALFLISVIFGARTSYRQATWGGAYAFVSPFKKASLYISLIQKRLFGEKRTLQDDYEMLAYRTDYLVTFCRVVELTPLYVPYWGGATYQTLYTSLIPRLLYPNKPKKTLGQDFGHRYGLLDPSDTSTSYNLPVFVEFYANHGPIGIAVGMFFLGLIFRTFYALFNHPDCGEGGVIMGVVTITPLLSFESDFSLTFGNIVQYLILLYVIIKAKIVNLEALKKVQLLKSK